MNAFLEKCSLKNRDSFHAAPVTVAFLGDSVTHGCFELVMTGENSFDTVYRAEKAYSADFVRILHTLYPAAQINLVNAGISGGNAPDGLKRLERDVLPYCPDLVVVCFGLNDCGAGRGQVSVYTDALKGIFEKLNAKNIPCIFMTPNRMCDYVTYVPEKLFRDVEERITKTQASGDLDFYIEEAKKIAEEMRVTVCDVYAKWNRMKACGVDTTALLSNHCNHPTEEMHWLFAESLAECLFSMEF